MDLDLISRGSKSNHIPTEVLSEILSCLPARSVIRFRCVCKQWRSITLDPCFIDAHLDRARKAAPPSILLFFSNYRWDRYGIAVTDENSRTTPKRILWGAADGKVFLGNSCNGLLCIYDDRRDKRIKVINPATGESLTLPANTETARYFLGAYLGFHPETKEYKALRFFHHSGAVGCVVYTLGTSNWRSRICIPDPHSLTCLFPPPAIAKGVVYWLIGVWECDTWKHSLLSFDLKSEAFAKISLPASKIYKEDKYVYRLVELQGSVCLTFIPPKDCTSQQMDIWMMTLNTDDNNNTEYEWALKYSLLLPIGNIFISAPLLIHNEKILVHTINKSVEGEPAELIYCHLKSKGQGSELFYHDGECASPMIYDYLKGENEIDKYLFHNCGPHYLEPFIHFESLVPLEANGKL